MKSLSVKAGYIPIDKTDTINKMLMDLFHGRGYDSIDFVKNSNPYSLPADVKQAAVAIEDWRDGEPVRVGQSGKLLRSLKFYAWEKGVKRKFVVEGSLKHRKTCDRPEIVGYSQRELLRLKDDETTQFASAKVLLGDEYRMKDPPFKLNQAYESYAEWNGSRVRGEMWKTKPDLTIARQADAIMYYVKSGTTTTIPMQPEDYPLYRVFGKITPTEGEAMWKRLRNHESDRIEETENTIDEVKKREPISSRDHRVIVAGVALQLRMRHKIEATYMDEVGKSWPQFPHFANYVENAVKYKKIN